MSAGRITFFAATGLLPIATLVLAALAPALLWLAAPATVVYAGLILAGAMTPRFAMFAPVVCRASCSHAAVALTFDDGPSPQTTRIVLSTLARLGARATFFVLASKVRRHPEILREIAAAGHDIGVHGDGHDRLLAFRHPDAIVSELERALTTIETVAGQRPRLFRPPLGHVSPRTAQAARRLGLTLVGWSVRARDGLASTSADSALRRVAAGLVPGAIVLLHDASEREQHQPAGVTALPAIIEEANKRGLRCVPLTELLGHVAAA
jgi:peptidoglycan-N-acetylglucosamine deacetylase